MLAHRRRGGHGLYHPIREVGRIGAGEAHPSHAVHRADGPQQIGVVVLPVVVRVDRLPEQGDLAGAAGRQLADLAHDLAEAAAPLGPAGLGHDAERAAVIAAALYRDERGRALLPHRWDVLVVLPLPELYVAEPLSRSGQADQ